MKKTSKLNPSSVPVQHSHTEAAAAPAAKPGAYPTKPDTRLPIDPEQRKINRTLTTAQVINRLADSLPDVYRIATTVGLWIWVQFPEQPAAEIRQQLSQLGFHWNATRQAWQHPCGKFSIAARATDPRDTYATKPANA